MSRKVNPQVLSVCNCFLMSQKQQLAPSSYGMYRLYCRKFIETYGSKTVDQITSSLVLDWVAKHYGQQSGSAQFNAARSIARMFRWAYDERQIPEYPLRGFRKPTASRRETFVSPQQYAALLRACVKNKVIDGVSTTVQHRCIRDAIKFLYHTGCRPQEMRKARAEWVKDRKIVFPVAESKGKKKARVIFLDDMAYRLVQRLCVERPTGTLFRSPSGKPWDRPRLLNSFRIVRKRAGLPQLSPYSFRHGFITRMLEKGVDVSTVAALAGNTPQTVFKFYDHCSKDDERLLSFLK